MFDVCDTGMLGHVGFDLLKIVQAAEKAELMAGDNSVVCEQCTLESQNWFYWREAKTPHMKKSSFR